MPADRKWYRDLVIATVINQTLKDLKMEYPTPDFDVEATLRDFDSLAGNIKD